MGPQLAGKPGESTGNEETRNRRSEAISAPSLLVAKVTQTVLKAASPARGSQVRIPALPASTWVLSRHTRRCASSLVPHRGHIQWNPSAGFRCLYSTT